MILDGGRIVCNTCNVTIPAHTGQYCEECRDMPEKTSKNPQYTKIVAEIEKLADVWPKPEKIEVGGVEYEVYLRAAWGVPYAAVLGVDRPGHSPYRVTLPSPGPDFDDPHWQE